MRVCSGLSSNLSGALWQGLLILLILLMFPAASWAVDYDLAGGWPNWNNYPPCSGTWSSSWTGTTQTCTGTITLANGDSIRPNQSRTLIARGGLAFAGNNTIGSADYSVNLQTDWGTMQINGSGNVVYGNVSSNSGAISLSNTTVNGTVSTSGSVTLVGGSVTGSVTAGNGVTATHSVVAGSVTASTGPVSLNGGSVAGSVSSGCCVVSTLNTNIGGGISSASNTVSIEGGTVSGPISSAGGGGVIIQNATVVSGSITANGVPIHVSGSTLGSMDYYVNVSSSNVVNLSANTTVYGDVTAGGWPNSLVIDDTSQVSGNCTPDHPRCHQTALTCAPPPGSPAGLSCVCDDFNRTSLNPSPIFGSNWVVSRSDSTGILPSIVSNRLRLTNNTNYNAKAATVPAIFPAAGNYVSIDFKLYAYNGNGADGIAVTLSDYATPAIPGAYGGSLGYAQRCGGTAGFAGGWLGVGIDEYGNFRNDEECRGDGGSPSGRVLDSVAVRGSGAGTNGYLLLGSTGTLSPGVDQSGSTPNPGHRYRIVVDHSNNLNAWAAVYRDTGSGYAPLFGPLDVKSAPGQAPVPPNWQISFTGSTGGSNNIHEIDDLRICASSVFSPSGGTASGFSAIDSAYGNASGSSKPDIGSYLQGHIYTKLMGLPFQLNVAALDSNNEVQDSYVVSGNKYVQVKLVDNADGACVLDSTKPNFCSASCVGKPAVAGGSNVLTFTASHVGQQRTTDFTLNTAYKRLAVVMRECTASNCSNFTSTPAACGVDAFSVRPKAISALAFAAGNRVTGVPGYEAGTPFTMTATIDGIAGQPNGYTGNPKVNNASKGLLVLPPATNLGTLTGSFDPAVPGTRTAISTGSNFIYSEVGHFRLLGYDPAQDATSVRGVYDGVMDGSDCPVHDLNQCELQRPASWTGVDSISSKGDCIKNSFSNVRDDSGSYKTNDNYGKYGCNFGLVADVDVPGVFFPHHFNTAVTAACGGSFTYSGQPFSLTVSARNASNEVTKNYNKDAYAKATVFAAIDADNVARVVPGTFDPTGVEANSFVDGVAKFGDPEPPNNPTVRFTFADKLDGPTKIQVRVVDADGVTSLHGTEGTTPLRSGRLRLANVYGYAAPLQLPLELQYWSGHSWTTNGEDVCTSLAASHFSVKNDDGTGSNWGVGTPILVAGKGSVALTPTARGSVRVCTDLGVDPAGGVVCTAASSAAMPWLQSKWPPGAHFDNDPFARATFGIFSPESRKGVYNRELY